MMKMKKNLIKKIKKFKSGSYFIKLNRLIESEKDSNELKKVFK
jgi:hypothetical protein